MCWWRVNKRDVIQPHTRKLCAAAKCINRRSTGQNYDVTQPNFMSVSMLAKASQTTHAQCITSMSHHVHDDVIQSTIKLFLDPMEHDSFIK